MNSRHTIPRCNPSRPSRPPVPAPAGRRADDAGPVRGLDGAWRRPRRRRRPRVAHRHDPRVRAERARPGVHRRAPRRGAGAVRGLGAGAQAGPPWAGDPGGLSRLLRGGRGVRRAGAAHRRGRGGGRPPAPAGVPRRGGGLGRVAAARGPGTDRPRARRGRPRAAQGGRTCAGRGRAGRRDARRGAHGHRCRARPGLLLAHEPRAAPAVRRWRSCPSSGVAAPVGHGTRSRGAWAAGSADSSS